MALTTYTRVNKYKIPRGTPGIEVRRADGSYEGIRWFGNTPAFDLQVESENYQHTSSESGLNQIDLDVPISITRTSNITIDNLDNDNIAMFLGAETATFIQTSATVTDEAILGVQADRSYQLGRSLTLAGVRGVSAVSVESNQAARANSTAYDVGDIYAPATPNNHIYACTVAGTSAGTPPTFTTDGTTFADGTATFIDLGTVNALASGTDFIVDADAGLVSFPAAGKLGACYNAAIAAGLDDEDFRINALCDYTRAANSRVQIEAGGTAALRGRLTFKADNAYGENQDVVIPDCTLSPTGTLPFVGANEAASMQFTVGISILDSNTPPVIIVGAAA